MKQAIYLLITCTLSVSLANGAVDTKVTTQTLTWNKIEATLKLPKKFSTKLEIQDRSFFHPLAQHQFFVRGTGFYSLNHGWSFFMGYTYFLQSPQDPTSESNLIAPEHRPAFGFVLKQNIRRTMLSQRYQLEERFMHNTTNGELAPGYKFIARLRYRIMLSVPLIDKDKKKGKGDLRLNLSDEIHLQAGKTVQGQPFDQNRASALLEYSINSQFSIFTGYTHWYQQVGINQHYYNRHIIDSGLSFAFELGKKNKSK